MTAINGTLFRYLALLALASACSKPAAAPPPPVGVTAGSTAPAFRAHNIDGAAVTLASLRGRVVVLNQWATWCEPCRAELPVLESLAQRNSSRGLSVVGVSIDAAGMAADVRDFARANNMQYTIWLDPDNQFSLVFATTGVPATLVIDRAGVLLWRHLGAISPNDTMLTAAVNRALASQ